MLVWRRETPLLAIGLLLACAGAALAAPATSSVRLAASSTLGFDGDSTLHAYRVKATRLELSGEVVGLAADTTAQNIDAALCRGRATLTVPVRSLRSGNGGLDDNMRKALNARAHPNIVFRFASCRAVRRNDGSYDAVVSGALTVAGAERALDVALQAWPGPRVLRLKGSTALKMSDFGIEPPSFLFGRVRATDDIRVFFDLRVQPVARDRSPTPKEK